MRLMLWTVVLLALPGCSSGSRAGVAGRVSYAGEPLSLGSITFIPITEGGIKGGGQIVNGAYKVDPAIGLAPGSYRVEIRWARATGRKYKNEFGEQIDFRQEGLPEKYHAKSTLTRDIKAGENVVDFELDQ